MPLGTVLACRAAELSPILPVGSGHVVSTCSALAETGAKRLDAEACRFFPVLSL